MTLDEAIKHNGAYKKIMCHCEEKVKETEMEKHTDRQIYDGCIQLMEKMVDYFHEYIDYIGYDFTVEDPDERFSISFMPTEIVRTLFLSGTGHDGGTSCRMKCKELGIEDKPVKFDFGKYKETDPEKHCDNCGQPRDYKGTCIPFGKGECKKPHEAWIPKERQEEWRKEDKKR